MILRKTKVALLLPVAVWLLTGCVKLNVDLVVNRDGSGVYGLALVNTAGYEWTIDLDKGANIHMVSEVWNWLNIALFGIGLGALALLSLVTIGGGVIWTLRQRSPARAAPGKSLSSRAPVRNTSELFPATPVISAELLAAIKARKYLEQTNRKLFQGQGDIAETTGAITLSWLERGARQQIVIRVVNAETVTINGQPVPATEAGVRQGLINHLKQINKIRERS